MEKKTVMVSFRTTPGRVNKANEIAMKEEWTFSEVCDRALDKFIDNYFYKYPAHDSNGSENNSNGQSK